MHITGLFCQVPVPLHFFLEERNRFIFKSKRGAKTLGGTGNWPLVLTRGAGHSRAWEEWVRVRELATLCWHMVPHRLSSDRQFTVALKLC